jgi:hypothetical protein
MKASLIKVGNDVRSFFLLSFLSAFRHRDLPAKALATAAALIIIIGRFCTQNKKICAK